MSRFSGSITSTTTRNALFKIGLAIRDNIKHVGTIVSFSQLRKYNKTLPVLELSLDRISCVMFGSVFTARNSLPRYFIMLLPTSRAWPAPFNLFPDYFGILCILRSRALLCWKAIFSHFNARLQEGGRLSLDEEKKLPLCIKLQKRCENRSSDIYT